MADKLAEKVLSIIAEQERLRNLTNHELVIECLNLEAADYGIVCEMMDRLYPGWENDEPK